jgi:hypothetical protein
MYIQSQTRTAMSTNITKEMMRAWIGGDNLNVDYLLDVMLEIVNEEYSLNSFYTDILDYLLYEGH